jgi:subtilisin family serine protease
LDRKVREAKRQRKTWQFETLEDRCLFAISPTDLAAMINASGSGYSGTLAPEQVTAGEIWRAFEQASDLSKYSVEQLSTATEWAVWTVDPASGSGASTAYNPYSGGGIINAVNTGNMWGGDVISLLSNADNVLAFYPVVSSASNVQIASPIDEPLFSDQWHLRNIGQQVGNPDFQEIFAVPGEDVNVLGAWNRGYSGAGVVVAVVDSGFQTNHPDLFDNYRADLSADLSGTGVGSHGTAVAGLIGADGNNNYGAVGVAYGADLVNVDTGNEIGLTTPYETIFGYRNNAIDIYNMSFGEGVDGRQAIPLTNAEVDALRNAVRFGRVGADGRALGNIFVKASGNDGGTDFTSQGFPQGGNWDSAQYDGLANSRYVITVGAVDHDGVYFNTDGTLTNYPEAGANVLVVAPTGSVSLDVGVDFGVGSGILTTDRTGGNGYNADGPLDGDFLTDTNFTSRFNGTSAATPIVSGAIALMLEANPNLSYRDVQEILVRSARQNSLQEFDGDYINTAEGWQTNMYEFWQSPAIGLTLADPDDPENLDLKVVPIEDPFDRSDIIGFGSTIISSGDPIFTSGRDLDAFRTFGGFYAGGDLGIHPIDNYSIYNLPRYDNGAGYTVHDARGIYSEEYGYAHGVVDAELAVKLAEQWGVKGQSLAPELTYTTFARPSNFRISSAAYVGPDGAPDLFVIPGLIGGAPQEEFHAYYDEFFADDPFSDDDPPQDDNGTYIPISDLDGFDPPLMQVEWVEVVLQISGMDMNQVRVALRSPDGTVSDLSMQLMENRPRYEVNINFVDQDDFHADPGTAPGDGTFKYTYSTNRHWGERSDSFFEVDPTTGDIAIDPDSLVGFVPNTGGVLYKSWDLIIENYDGSSSGVLDGFEVIFHGTPIGEGTERISGKVGIDAGSLNGTAERGDGNFNFSRGYDVDVDPEFDSNGDGIDDNDVDTRIIDRDPEPFAENITVQAWQGEVLVSQFVTGADGNYYFDLAPGDYEIKVVDPEGRTVMDDSGLNPRYLSTWEVTIDPTDNFTRNAGRQVPIDDDGDGIQDFDDTNMNGIQDPSEELKFAYLPYTDVDFLLDAGEDPGDVVSVSGTVYADANANGVVDGGMTADVGIGGFLVYADLNNSGAFEQGEYSATTDDLGNYSFDIEGITDLQNIKIIAQPIPSTEGWLATNPVTGYHTILRNGGEVVTGLDFLFNPPANTTGEPVDPSLPGTILGQVYSDRNGNGVQNLTDGGVSGVRVFVDANGDLMFNYTDANSNGVFDEGDTALEPTAVTNQYGGYALNKVVAGLVNIFVMVPPFYELTSPSGIPFRQVDLVAGGIVNNVKFGIHNLANSDYGDLLGAGYNTTGPNAASHTIVDGFYLGSGVDGELAGQPTANADGDDLVGADEDGVIVLGAANNQAGVLVAGTTNVVQVTVNGVGGYLNAWMDFNRDGDFDDTGEHAIIDVDLNPGTYSLQFQTPAGMAAGPIPARFRWGKAEIGYSGHSNIGEVEDYLLTNQINPVVVTVLPGDYDQSGTVDHGDYVVWKTNFGTTNPLADGNGDGHVDAADYSVWRDNLGKSLPASGEGSAALSVGEAGAGQSGTSTSAQVVRQGVKTSAEDIYALMLRSGATPVTISLGGFTRTVFVSGTAAVGGSGGGAAVVGAGVVVDNSFSFSEAAANRPFSYFSVTTTSVPGSSFDGAGAAVAVAQDADDASLLLVDRAVVAMLRNEDELDDNLDLYRSDDDQSDEDLDLALATAFEDDSDWWLAR